MRVHLRRCLTGAVVLGVIASITACTSGGSSSTNAHITLTYMNIYTSGAAKGIVQDVIKKFEAKHPNVTVKQVNVNTADENTKYKTLLAAGSAPDIAELDSGESQNLITQGAVQPVDFSAAGYKSEKDLEDAYIGGVLDGYRYKGKLYALPEEYSNYQPWVNTNEFNKAGVSIPTTWDEACADGPKLLKKDSQGRVTQEELALPNDPGVEYTFLESFVRGYGGVLFGGKNYKTSELTSKPDIEAFTELQHLVYDCQASFPSINPPVSAGGDRTAFAAGTNAMLLTGGSWMTGLMKAPVVPPVAKVVKSPTGPAGVGNVAYGYGYLVSTQSKHPKEAWEFVRALSDDGTAYLEQDGLFNGRKDVADSDVAKKTPYWATNWVPSLEASKYVDSYESTQIGSVVAQAMTKIITQKADVKQTLEDANAQVKPLLAKQ